MSDLKKKYEEGLDLLGDLKLPEAKACFEEITQKDAKNGAAWMFLGDIYLLEGDFENSKAAHEKASKIDSSYGYPKIEAKTRRDDYAEWKVKLNKKHDAKIMYGIPMGIMFDFGNGPGSLTIGGNLEDKERVVFPADVNVNLGRTEVLLGLISPMYPVVGGMLASTGVSFGRYINEEINERAPSLSEKGGFMKKGNTDEWAKQGAAFEILDRIEEAARAYAGALKIDPKNDVAQRGLVKCINRDRTGRRIKNHVYHPIAQASIQQYEQLVHSPIFAKARRGNDVILSQNDVLCLALRAFVHMDYQEATTFDKLSEKARIYLDIDDYTLALEFLEKALDIQPENKEMLEQAGLSYFRMQNFDKTAELLSKLVKIDTGNANAWAHLGISQLFLGKPDESEANLRKALELDDTHDLALLNLTSLLIQVKKCDDAKKMLDKVKKRLPQEVWGVVERMMIANCR